MFGKIVSTASGNKKRKLKTHGLSEALLPCFSGMTALLPCLDKDPRCHVHHAGAFFPATAVWYFVYALIHLIQWAPKTAVETTESKSPFAEDLGSHWASA